MKKWGCFGTLVDPETIKARKLHMVKYGCFGTEVPAEVIEERKKALRDWWTPARRQAASERWTPKMRQDASDWWDEERRDDQSELKVKWWSDEDEGVARREAYSLSTYLAQAAKRGETNPPDPIWMPPATVCPSCDKALGMRRIVCCRMHRVRGDAQAVLITITCPHCRGGTNITSAARRAEVLASCPADEGGEALEQAIMERMALVVSRFNAAKEDAANKKGMRFSPYTMPPFVTDVSGVYGRTGRKRKNCDYCFRLRKAGCGTEKAHKKCMKR